MSQEKTFTPGLKGVVALETGISLLDTQQEKIIIRGYDLIELSKVRTYADMIHLLLENELPNDSERHAVEKKLTDHQHIPEAVTNILQLLPKGTHAMDGQRTALSALAGYDTDLSDHSEEANQIRAYQILGQLPFITANSYRTVNGLSPASVDPNLSYSANFLAMMTGQTPTELEADIFDRSLLLYSEHEMPNSTFTSRVIASTNSDMYGALSGAVASLKGNLHGGANEAVMQMLEKAETVEGFKQLLRDKLARKEKIMGFGHRVYMKQIDPRASMMKESLKALCDIQGDSRLLDMCEAGETVMREEKGLYPNLDYYAAPVYWMLGIPVALYTPIFFSARTAGLCAHIIEQHRDNHLFRPRVKYTGPSIQ